MSSSSMDLVGQFDDLAFAACAYKFVRCLASRTWEHSGFGEGLFQGFVNSPVCKFTSLQTRNREREYSVDRLRSERAAWLSGPDEGGRRKEEARRRVPK